MTPYYKFEHKAWSSINNRKDICITAKMDKLLHGCFVKSTTNRRMCKLMFDLIEDNGIK